MSFNQLSPAEAERLAILSEEMGEAIQAIGKILRHGYEAFSPFDPEKTPNRVALQKEIGDVKYAIETMTKCGDLDINDIEIHQNNKRGKILPYLHHQVGARCTCAEEARSHQLECEKWSAQWPNHCEQCRGLGGSISQTGDGWNEPVEWDFDECQECSGSGKCPRCSAPLDFDLCVPCGSCGYRLANYQDAMPTFDGDPCMFCLRKQAEQEKLAEENAEEYWRQRANSESRVEDERR